MAKKNKTPDKKGNKQSNSKSKNKQNFNTKNTPNKYNPKLHKGAAFRTRDEYLQGGVPKAEYQDNPKQYYRVVYTVDINSDNEAAVVRRTSSKGRHLKTQPEYKFHEQVYTKDNEGNGIKSGKKFVRSVNEDITKTDVDYINKRISHYPDTAEKLKEFKNRNKKSPK